MEFISNIKLISKHGIIRRIFNDGSNHSEWRGLVEFKDKNNQSNNLSYVSSQFPIYQKLGESIDIVGKQKIPFNQYIECEFVADNSLETRINSILSKKTNVKISLHGNNINFTQFVKEFVVNNFKDNQYTFINSNERKEDLDYIQSIIKPLNIKNRIVFTDTQIESLDCQNVLNINYLDKVILLNNWINKNNKNIFFPKNIPDNKELRKFYICQDIANHIIKTNNLNDCNKDKMTGLLFLINDGNIKTIDYLMTANIISQLSKDDNKDINFSTMLSQAKNSFENILSQYGRNNVNLDAYISNSKNNNYLFNYKAMKRAIELFKECYPKWENQTTQELSVNIKKFSCNLTTKNLKLKTNLKTKKIVKNISNVMNNMADLINQNSLSPMDIVKYNQYGLIKLNIDNMLKDYINDNLNHKSGEIIEESLIETKNLLNKNKTLTTNNDNLIQSSIDNLKSEITKNKFFKKNSFIIFLQESIILPLAKPLSGIPIKSKNNIQINNKLWNKINNMYKKSITSNKQIIIDTIHISKDKQQYGYPILSNDINNNENQIIILKEWGEKTKKFMELHRNFKNKNQLSNDEIDIYNKIHKHVSNISFNIIMDKYYYDILSKIDNPYNDLSSGIQSLLKFKVLKHNFNNILKEYNEKDIQKAIDYILNPTTFINYQHNLFLLEPDNKFAKQLVIDGNYNIENIDFDKISNFSQAILKNITFKNEDLEYKKMTDTNFINCDFNNINSNQINFDGCIMTNCYGINKSIDISHIEMEHTEIKNQENDINYSQFINKPNYNINY